MRVWFVGDFSIRNVGDLTLIDSPFKEGDSVIANYEGVVDKLSKFENNRVYLGQSSEGLSLAQRVGITHFGVANNHVHDFGEEVFEAAIDALKTSGFEVAGFSGKRGSQCSLVFSTSGGKCVEVFCVVTAETGALTDAVSRGGLCCCDAESKDLLEFLAKNKEKGVVSVVYVHWGETNYRYPSWKMRTLAAEYLKRGARYVVGHHSHVVQGREKKANGDVFYSLGNFVFDEYFGRKGLLRLPAENRESLVVGIDFDTDEVDVLRAIYNPLRRELEFHRDLGLQFSIYSAPLRLAGWMYSIFIRFYFAFRLLKRAAYWLHPARINQVGPRQFGALCSLVMKLLGRSK